MFTRGLHAKLYIADFTRALITSANLTQEALQHNFEMGVLIKGEKISSLVEVFSVLWSQARSVSYEWINDLSKLEADSGVLNISSFVEGLFGINSFYFAPKQIHKSQTLPHIQSENFKALAEELANWLIAVKEDGQFDEWRKKAVLKFKTGPNAFLSNFSYHTTCYSAKFYSFARQKKILLVSIPTHDSPTWLPISFPIKFTSPYSQAKGKWYKKFDYPNYIEDWFAPPVKATSSSRYPIIDLIDENALEAAKTVIQYLLQNV